MPATAHDVAAAILRRHLDDDRYGEISPMKLNKLLYAAQGIHMAQTGAPGFDDDSVQAWDDGPVVPSVWRTFRNRRYLYPDDLSRLGDEGALGPSESEAVDCALEMYGSFSGDALSELSHSEWPWIEAYERGRNSDLDHAELATYFSKVLATREQEDPEAALNWLTGLLSGA